MTDDKKTIFMIGASRGCGNHVAERFGREGFRVVLLSRNAERLDGYAQEFRAKRINTDTAVIDVSNSDSMSAAIESMRERYDGPDVMFYNVGDEARFRIRLEELVTTGRRL